MGVSRNFGELAIKLHLFSAGVQGVGLAATIAGGKIITHAVMANLGSPSGKPVRLRNVGRGATEIGVKTVLKGRINPTILASAFGPFHLVEKGTSAHTIPSPERVGDKHAKRIKIPGMGVFSVVNHPGTRGKHPWRRGLIVAKPLIKVGFAYGLNKAFMAIFGGSLQKFVLGQTPQIIEYIGPD